MPEIATEKALNVDFPRQREKIVSAEYTFRIAAPADAERVEVSIDELEWRPCRSAAGSWWYDWSRYAAGSHQLVSRAHLRDGRTVASEPRSFRVEFGAEAVVPAGRA
ncbi:MAG: hypothetical protein HYZ75_12600 [Elusimicrobia bacterium]|nr:hypothetical protein [Elusimicrobiota bacterium]